MTRFPINFHLPVMLLAGLLFFASATRLAAAEPAWDVYTTSSGMAINDDILFLTWPGEAQADARYLVAIDISEPARPALLDKLELAGFPQGIAMAGSHILVTNGRSLLVIDASSPQKLRMVHQLQLSDDAMRGPQGIDVHHDVAYLACRLGGVMAVDIKNPQQPRILDTLSLPGFVRDVTALGDRLYVAGDTKGMHLINTANPASLSLITTLPAPRGTVSRVRVAGSTAYVTAGNVLIGTVSLANPDQPQWLGVTTDRHVLSTFYGSYAHDLTMASSSADATKAAQTHHIFVADGESGLIVVDVTQPGRPGYAGAAVAGQRPGVSYIATAIRTQGNYVYLTDQRYGLRVFDASSPTKPTLIGEGVRLTK